MDATWLACFLEQLQAPSDQVLLDHAVNDRLRHGISQLRAVLRTHLLKDGDVEPLGDRAILLFLERLDDLFKDGEIHSLGVGMGHVVDTLRSANDDRDQSQQRVFQPMVFHSKHAQDKILALGLLDVENVNFDELLNQVSPLIRRNLESIDPQAQQDFRHGLLRLSFIGFSLQQLGFMVFEDLLRDQQMRVFTLLVIFQLQQQNFVISAQLDFIVINTFTQILGIFGPIFQIIQVLEAIDGDRENLSG